LVTTISVLRRRTHAASITMNATKAMAAAA
jgi:hypothetical protein